jgi:hypothetical protein
MSSIKSSIPVVAQHVHQHDHLHLPSCALDVPPVREGLVSVRIPTPRQQVLVQMSEAQLAVVAPQELTTLPEGVSHPVRVAPPLHLLRALEDEVLGTEGGIGRST